VTSDPFVVVEIDLPELAITGPALYCENGSTTLNASAGYDAYIWSNGVPGTSATVEEGVYTVTAVLGACSATSDPFAVTEAPNPQPVIVGPPVQCGDALAELSTQLPYVTYLWSDNTQGSTTTVGAGPWTVTVTDANGCSGTSSPFVVINAPFPVAGFTVDPPSPAPVETTVDFTNTSTVSGGVISSWQWNFGILGQTSSEPSPSFTYTGPGDYLVTLVVTTAAGCSDTTSQLYVVFPPDLRIPNVFTPNGDNVNDTYSIENLRYYGHELRIYSRWGTLVHESSDASREWRASEQPDGTYYYVLTLQDGRELAGHITVLR
jgi:gliding motility-associated-like protein